MLLFAYLLLVIGPMLVSFSIAIELMSIHLSFSVKAIIIMYQLTHSCTCIQRLIEMVIVTAVLMYSFCLVIFSYRFANPVLLIFNVNLLMCFINFS